MKKLKDAPENTREHPETLHRSSLTTKLLLSIPETADLLGISKRTVYVLLAAGELTRRKVRRRTVIHRNDILRFAARITASRGERND